MQVRPPIIAAICPEDPKELVDTKVELVPLVPVLVDLLQALTLGGSQGRVSKAVKEYTPIGTSSHTLAIHHVHDVEEADVASGKRAGQQRVFGLPDPDNVALPRQGVDARQATVVRKSVNGLSDRLARHWLRTSTAAL